jgi:hypothetical protein
MEMTDHTPNSGNCEFELNPFISDIARLFDRELLGKHPEFGRIEVAERVFRICSELPALDVAIETRVGNLVIWIPTDEIEERIGGSAVTKNARLKIGEHDQSKFAETFQLVIKEHVQRRIAHALEIEEGFFALCNLGLIRIIRTNADGSYVWAATRWVGPRPDHAK